MQNKSIIRIPLATTCILLVPLLGNLFMGWKWPPFAFAVWGALLFGTGLTYELVARKGDTIAYRVATGMAVAAALLLFGMSAVIKSPVAKMHFAVLAVAFFGACIARLRPRGMSCALFATALAQALVPVIALVFGITLFRDLEHPGHPGIVREFGLTSVFVALWLISAWLFRKAARKQPPAVAGRVG